MSLRRARLHGFVAQLARAVLVPGYCYRLEGCGLDQAGARELAGALRALPSLTELSYVRLGLPLHCRPPRPCWCLSFACADCRLLANPIGEGGAEVIASALVHTTELTALEYVPSALLCPWPAALMVNASALECVPTLIVHKCRECSLSKCELGAVGARSVSRALQWLPSLSTLLYVDSGNLTGIWRHAPLHRVLPFACGPLW